MKSLRLSSPFVSCCLLAGLIVAPAVVAVSGCQTVPVSGRKRIAMVTPESQEIAMGEQAYEQILAEEALSNNADAVAMVERVGRRIAAVAGRDDYDWEFKLVAGPTKNAFCLPGGKVAVHEGILPICQNEAGLAVVMSHEIAHALARHGGERMNQQMVVNGVKSVGGLLGNKYLGGEDGKLDPKTLEYVGLAYGLGTQYGVVLPYSRKHETEADLIGLQLMAKAGYDPSEAPMFWDRFSQESGPKPPEFFSTHPSDMRRAIELRERLPDALAFYRAAPEKFELGDPVPEIQLASHNTDAATEQQPVQSAAATATE